MNKNIRYILLGAVVILTIVFLLLNAGGKKKINFNWDENYRENNREPYGTYVVHELLKDYYKDKEFTTIDENLVDVLPTTEADEIANYVFIGNGIYLDSADMATLLTFTANGNNVFISSKSVPDDLMESYLYPYGNSCDYEHWDSYDNRRDTVGYLNLSHPNLKNTTDYSFKYVDNFETDDYSWHYIDDAYFCEEQDNFEAIGSLDGYNTNFVKVEYGLGSFYLHTTPLAFTNYHLLEEENLAYANKVFSHLTEGDIYFDAFNHVGEFYEGNGADDDMAGIYEPVRLKEDSPLEYILSEPSLRWTWYLLLAIAFLYVIFRAKRKQRIIPVLEENTNTSLEFIQSIGTLYFQQNNHAKLCQQKMKLFLSFIRERYNIVTHNFDDKQLVKLAKVSDISEAKIRKIFDLHKDYSTRPSLSAAALIDFHHAVDYFYKKCK
jgi:hypothetical protein